MGASGGGHGGGHSFGSEDFIMARHEDWIAEDISSRGPYSALSARHHKRQAVVQQAQLDLYDAALDLGQTTAQAIAKIDDLFATFASEWFLWLLDEHPSLVTAIQNDATIPWLDTEYPPASGVDLRQRIINRLTI